MRLLAATPNGYILGQFDNPANPQIHFETTGPEIWNDTDGQVDFLISGVGTGGTLTGVAAISNRRSRALKRSPLSRLIALCSQEASPVRTRFRDSARDLFPAFWTHDLIDEVIQVSNEEAMAMAVRLPLEEGLFVGISSGAAVHAALQVANRPENAGKLIVVIIPSFGERYLSTVMFDALRQEVQALKASPIA